MATQADLNKTSPAPQHAALYNAAIEMTGGPRYTTSYDAEGNVTRKPIEPKPWALGLALALNVLSGGLAGGNAKDSIAAAQAGAQVAEHQRAKVQQANQQQDAQAKADQDRKMAITRANMVNYQTALQVGAASKAVADKLGDSTDFFTKGVLDGTTPLGEGMSHSEAEETDAIANVKNGKSNITKDFLIPYGPAIPVLDTNGQQKFINGQPIWKHMYMTIHGAANGKMPLTKEMQDAFISHGLMKPTGAGIGTPDWNFSNIADNLSQLTSIDTGERLLQEHKDDATQLLGHAGTGGPVGKDGKRTGVQDLSDLAGEVKNDPQMRKAVALFARAQASTPGANHHIEDVLNTMGTIDPSLQGVMMNHLGLSSKDLDDMHNKRAAAAAEAGAEGKAEAIAPKTMGDALAMKYNPASTPEQKKWADGVIDGFNKQAQDKADTAADAAAAKEDYKQALRDQRTMGYVEDQNGDVYHVSRWQADHMPNYSAQTFIEKKPSDISADQKAIKPINDIQNNINGYRAANSAYDAAAKSNKVNVASDRSNLTTIFSAPAITDAAAAHAGVEGFGITVPTLAADLNKDLANKVLKAYNALSPEGKTMADSYARMRGAIPAYVKVITNTGRGSKEQLDIELQNIMPPYFNQSDISHRLETFQGNLDTQKAGFPKNLAGSHFVPTSGASVAAPMFRRDPQTKAVQKSTDGGKTWQ